VPENGGLAAHLAKELADLLPSRSRLMQMALAARAQSRTDAAERVADFCLAEARA
jgi:UDP-N-acetylglucosamine:LPS N-acetylglucosamine transferase